MEQNSRNIDERYEDVISAKGCSGEYYTRNYLRRHTYSCRTDPRNRLDCLNGIIAEGFHFCIREIAEEFRGKRWLPHFFSTSELSDVPAMNSYKSDPVLCAFQGISEEDMVSLFRNKREKYQDNSNKNRKKFHHRELLQKKIRGIKHQLSLKLPDRIMGQEEYLDYALILQIPKVEYLQYLYNRTKDELEGRSESKEAPLLRGVLVKFVAAENRIENSRSELAEAFEVSLDEVVHTVKGEVTHRIGLSVNELASFLS